MVVALRKPPALPYRRIADNLLFTQRDAWAVFRIQSRSYRSEPERRKAALVNELEAWAKSAEADFQILRVNRYLDVDDWVARREGQYSREWDEYLGSQKEALERLDSWLPSVYLAVRLAPPNMDLQGWASRAFDRTPREMWTEYKARARDVSRSREVADRARMAQGKIEAYLDARPAHFDEVQWLIRRSFTRGISEPISAPPEPNDGERAIKYWFGENLIEDHYQYITAEGDEKKTFQAGLCLGEVLHAYPFSRQVELMLAPVEDCPWPIDVALNVRYVTSDQAKRQAFGLFKRTANQLKDEEQGEFGAMDSSVDRVALVREYHDRLGDLNEPMLMGTLSYIITAQHWPELRRRCRVFRDSYPWPIYRPPGCQLDVWRQHLPGQPSLVKGYERPFTPEQVGAMVPHGTHESGSDGDDALYLARTIHGNQPVFFDPREGSRTDKPTTVALLGTLGGGKTMALQTLLYQAYLQDARIVDIDPKNDHRFHLMEEVRDQVEEIVLDGTSTNQAGRLDPLRVAPRGERHDAAATFLTDILHDPDGNLHAEINGAVAAVLEEHGEKACCMEVIARLEKDGKRAGEQLRHYCSAGVARLGFAKLNDPLPTLSEKRVTYINIRALKRSGIQTVRSEMSQSQRHGRAVLQLIALYAMRILGEERDRLKVLAFDEASFLTEDAMGRQLLDQLARWGRSELAVPIFSTQLLKDVAEQDNLIGHWFLFAMKSPEHAALALEKLEMDVDGPLTTALTERYPERPGSAVYRDLKGRAEEIRIDPGARLLEEFSTTAGTQRPSLVDVVGTVQ